MPNASQLPVTVIVPIKNEGANLARCLTALQPFAEVIVADSGSTDASLVIAKSFGARVVQFQWDGKFPKKRNWCLRNCELSHDWVLFIDADETVTQHFVEEVGQAIQNPAINGYWIQFENYFMGRLLRHGDRFRKLALVRRGCGEYEHIPEEAWSGLDMEVHEHIVVQGAVGVVKAPVDHNDYKGLEAYYRRHNDYSSWEAARYRALGAGAGQALTSRQRLKYRLLTSPVFPPLYFLGSYLGRGGFLDGAPGFCFAVGKMFYFYQIQFKIRDARRRVEAPTANVAAKGSS